MGKSSIVEIFVKGLVAGLTPPVGVLVVQALASASWATPIVKILFGILLLVAIVAEVWSVWKDFTEIEADGIVMLIAYSVGYVWALIL
jgi:hypothetical protein